MIFISYKNSFLASICSLFGTAFLVLALVAMVKGELDILSGVIMIAIGGGMMYLAKVISDRKAKKQRAKAAKAAAKVTYDSAPQPARPAQPQVERTYTAPAAPKQTMDPELQKQLQAYKDLLEMGILSKEEYDQKVRDMTRGI